MALNKVDLCGVDTSKLPVLTNAQMQALEQAEQAGLLEDEPFQLSSE